MVTDIHKKISAFLKNSGWKILNFFSLLLFLLIIFMGYKTFFSKSPALIKNFNASQEAQKIKLACTNQDKQDCYKKQLVDFTKIFGLGAGETTLNDLQLLDDDAKNCHVIAHFMSREAYNRKPGNFEELLKTLNVKACGSGFLHGVLEAYVASFPETQINGKFADHICNKNPDPYWQRMCVHFMGHIFLLETEGNVKQALPLCTDLKSDWQFDCLDGLFMEDHQKLALAEHGLATLPVLTPKHLNTLAIECNQYAGAPGTACWTEMAEMYAHYSWYDPKQIYEGCQQAKTPTQKIHCYNKGIIVTAIYTGFDTPEKLLSICQFFKTPDELRNCVNMQISAFMYYSPNYTQRGITLCSSLALADQSWCFAELGRSLKTIVNDKSQRENLCATAEKKYKNLCIGE